MTLSILYALCGDKHNLAVKEVPLSSSAQHDVNDAFSQQEDAFRNGDEVPFDQNWLNDGHEIFTSPIPEGVDVFAKIARSTDTAMEPINTRSHAEVRGLAIKTGTDPSIRILVQLFAASQSLNRQGKVSLFIERNTYTRLTSSAFRLDDKLVCIVEDDMIKFHSLYNLGRVIDTSMIFSAATDDQVRAFATTYSNLFYFTDVNAFVDRTSRIARRYLTSLNIAGILQDHTVETLCDASAATNLALTVRDDRIVMPQSSGAITELMRFLNDGRYRGPVSGKPFVTNSRRPVA